MQTLFCGERGADSKRGVNCRWRFGLLLGVAVLGLAGTAAPAQAPPFEWVWTAGGFLDDKATAVAVDDAGNTYLTGFFSEAANFGFTALTTQASNGDLFVAKLDSTGRLLWVRSGNASRQAQGTAIAVDMMGQVYVTGYFVGTLDLGATNLTSLTPEAADVFLLKFSRDGEVLWARQAGGDAADYGYALALDPAGNLHVVGSFSGQATFAGTELASAGGTDIFHAKYIADGDLAWVEKAGGTGADACYGVATDALGNCYLAGSFHGTSDFGGIALTAVNSYIDLFVAKSDPAGAILWARQAGGTDLDTAYGIATDAAGNSFVTGRFRFTAAFDRFTLTATNNEDIFVAKYNTRGDIQWARQAGSSAGFALEQGNAIAVDAAGNSFVTGFFHGTGTFGQTNLTGLGGQDLFIARYDNGGNVVWAQRARSQFNDVGAGIVHDRVGNTYVAGYFLNSAAFGATNVFSHGGNDIFVAKLPVIAVVRPAIVTQPQAQSLLPGRHATFEVIASGSPPLRYQWQFNEANLPGETNASLRVANVQPPQQGNYRVVVSNPGGSVTSQVAVLTLVYPPTITAQPQDQIAVAGQEARFAVDAAGTAPLHYRWRFNGLNLPDATNATWSIGHAQPGDAGDYTVVVTNNYGAVISRLATLAVHYALTLVTNGIGSVNRLPTWTNYPPNMTVTLSGIPSLGYAFSHWSGDASGTANPLTIVMNANKTVIANFDSTAITILLEGLGAVGKAPDKPYYALGEPVTLTAVAGRWHEFIHWGDGLAANPRRITIGLSNTYSAVFAPTTVVETLTIGGVSRVAPVGMPAVFVDGEFVPDGSVTRLDAAEIALRSTFPNGTLFFTLDGSDPSFVSALYFGPFPWQRSATIRAMAYNADFTQWWEADPVQLIIRYRYPLQVSTAGGGAVVVSPAEGPYLSHTPVTLVAAPANGWTFLQWLGDATGGERTNSVVMDRPRCVEAVFGTTLTSIATGNGAVRLDPAVSLYPYGTTVRLSALPAPGQAFAAWGNAAHSTNNPLSLVVTTAQATVSCLFAPLDVDQVALTVQAVGYGRAVIEPPANRYPRGRAVMLRAEPEPGHAFVRWSGDASGANNPLVTVMNQSRAITAHFTRQPALSVFACDHPAVDSVVPLLVTGQLGERYRIEFAPDLNAPWAPLVTLTNRCGRVQFNDRFSADRSNRFYRAVLLPGSSGQPRL